MNIKWMVLIVIILVLGLFAMELFVPKKIDLAGGTVSTFKKEAIPAEETEIETENA
ncbi:MAG: hypothetical protein MK066_13560 [Crocinitomicaceae bacterium]|nr:hypothetical protein [Crocinitomicaceae bacterium]